MEGGYRLQQPATQLAISKEWLYKRMWPWSVVAPRNVRTIYSYPLHRYNLRTTYTDMRWNLWEYTIWGVGNPFALGHDTIETLTYQQINAVVDRLRRWIRRAVKQVYLRYWFGVGARLNRFLLTQAAIDDRI